MSEETTNFTKTEQRVQAMHRPDYIAKAIQASQHIMQQLQVHLPCEKLGLPRRAKLSGNCATTDKGRKKMHKDNQDTLEVNMQTQTTHNITSKLKPYLTVKFKL